VEVVGSMVIRIVWWPWKHGGKEKQSSALLRHTTAQPHRLKDGRRLWNKEGMPAEGFRKQWDWKPQVSALASFRGGGIGKDQLQNGGWLKNMTVSSRIFAKTGVEERKNTTTTSET
jgi:hypothetical protein